METLNDLSTKNIQKERQKKSDKKLYMLLGVISIVIFAALASLSTVIFYTYKTVSDKAQNVGNIDIQTEEADLIRDKLNDIYGNSEAETKTNVSTKTTITTEDGTTVIETNELNNQNAPQEPICYEFLLNIGNIQSNNCYDINDFTLLVGAVNSYNTAVYTISSAQKEMEIACGNEFFEDACDNALRRKTTAEQAKAAHYKTIVDINSKY